MTKLAKLRNSPTAFFADSKRRILRVLGTHVAPRMEASPFVMQLLEDPHAAVRAHDLPIVSLALDAAARRAARKRKLILVRAQHPRVSIVVAARNAAQTIDTCLTSLRCQSYKNVEILVVDDHSNDHTAAIVATHAAADARVRLIQNTRQLGAAMSRNVGLERAAGEYLSFHDADDRSHAERIERQLAELLAAPDAVVVVCNFRRETPDREPVVVNGRGFAKNVISMIFPRSPVFRELGYMLDLSVGEDTEYYERIRTVYGRHREVHLFQTLYFAQYSPTSLLFSQGETRLGPGSSVTYERSPTAEAALAAISHRMHLIGTGVISPYAPPHGKPAAT